MNRDGRVDDFLEILMEVLLQQEWLMDSQALNNAGFLICLARSTISIFSLIRFSVIDE